MLENITYFNILGLSVLLWLGLFALVSLLFTAAIPILRQKGIWKIGFKEHVIMARITVGFALAHGILRILAFF